MATKPASAPRSGTGAAIPKLRAKSSSTRGLKKRRSAAEAPKEKRLRHQRVKLVRLIAAIAAGLVALMLVGVVAFFALRNSSVFEIEKVEFESTEHVSSEDVGNLAQVQAGSTLLNVDTESIETALRKNPWVASASFERVFPDTLVIKVEEKRVDALVLMSSGTVAWYLAEDGCWIEPVMITAAEGQSTSDAALAIAEQLNCLLVTDAPVTVEPEAGSAANDASLDAVQSFREGFSPDFASQVVCYSAPSAENVSCLLRNGVEVSLGSPEEIAEKERIVEGYLEQHQGAIVLINVRVVSNPAFREIDSENVRGGNGTTSTPEPSSAPAE